ncbi:MAG: hypothetical protein AAF639_37545 [Chloroflexota bacterium]
MDNPSLPGPFTPRLVTYAAPGLNYLNTQFLGHYFRFDNPTPEFETRRIDLSEIADFDFRFDWPFDNANVPINGQLYIPNDLTGNAGPYPVAVFAHGNHTPSEDSTPGYLYLCQLLATHGIIAATIDVNFLNGANRGENDGRAIVHLEHLKQFVLWNQQPEHPLFGKVDTSRFLIAGHSRGGEAVAHASLFNQMQSIQFDAFAPAVAVDGSTGLGPYQFPIQAVVAFAPTDQQYIPTTGLATVHDNYLLMHGSRDSDVSVFQGHLAYDRSHRLDPDIPLEQPNGFKSLLWIHGANHNFFNSEWGQESSGTIPRYAQEQIAKLYIGAIAQAQLLGRIEFLGLLTDHRMIAENDWLGLPVQMVSQYQTPPTLFIQHFEEPVADLQVISVIQGTTEVVGVTAQKQLFAMAQGGGGGLLSFRRARLDPTHHLLQDGQGVRIDWTQPGGRYTVQFDSTRINMAAFTHIALRVGQSFEPNNPRGVAQDFTVFIHDNANNTSFPFSTRQSLIYPDEFPQFNPSATSTDPVTVLQTTTIPLQTLQANGLNIAQLQRIDLVFDRTPTGTIYLDDIQLTNLGFLDGGQNE